MTTNEFKLLQELTQSIKAIEQKDFISQIEVGISQTENNENAFYDLARQLHCKREKERLRKWERFVRCGEEIYLYFKLWCYRNKFDEYINDKNAFEKYLKLKKISITETQRNYLYQNYFKKKEKGENENKTKSSAISNISSDSN